MLLALHLLVYMCTMQTDIAHIAGQNSCSNSSSNHNSKTQGQKSKGYLYNKVYSIKFMNAFQILYYHKL